MIERRPARATVEAALAALGPGDLVATDADNTLWAGDCGDDAMRWLKAAREPGLDVAAYLAREQVDYAGACRESAEHLARLGLTPGLRAFLATRLRLRGWLVQALQAAEGRGAAVVVVTAAPLDSAREALAHFGLPWPALGITVRDGAVVEPAPVGPGKALAWQAAGHAAPAVALGDSVHDEPLLALATLGFRLDPPTDE
ncbi:MAG: haloacid dehalogenase-like hydrolase, partial [Myxococcales bacterium]|nr:haloacid dehalogenase-like hydrolase [Myxococcales bacterium]